MRYSAALGAVAAAMMMVMTAGASAAPPLNNGDFSRGDVGKPPPGWSVPTGGFRSKVVEDDGAEGGRAAELGPDAGGGKAPFGNIMQAVDARPFRGQRIIVRGDVRLVLDAGDAAALRDARAQMWVRVDCAGGKMGFFDNMGSRPIRGLKARTFQTYSISGPVDDDATVINVGVMSLGGVRVRIANMQIEALPAGEGADRPAAALDERGMANLVALARLYGYVRFFHPSDEASGTDWETFAMAAVEHIEPAEDAADLAKRLQDVFGPIAATVRVWAGDEEDAPEALAKPDDAEGAIAWKHNGVQMGDAATGVYRSTRERVKTEGDDDAGIAAGTAVVKDLGGGVWCRVPVAVYVDSERRTLPRAMTGVVPLKPVRPEHWSPSGNDRSTRLADVVIAWNVFQHFYPYFDVVPTDWRAELPRALAAAATDEDEAAFERTLQRLVGALHDGHGNVIGSTMARARPPAMALDWAWSDAAGWELVVTVAGEGGGADGVRVGDVIERIGDEPVAAWRERCRGLVSAATEQWARHRLASDAAFIAPGDEDPVRYTVRRGEAMVGVRVPRARDWSVRLEEKRPAQGEEVAPGIVYFDLNGARAEALMAAMPKLAAARGIVFDLRGYPDSAGAELMRHLTDEPIQSARWNVPIVRLPDRDARGLTWNTSGRWQLQPAEPRLGADGQRIVFLTGGGAISYAESCMGIVEHYQLAEIVGEATAGTNGNVNPMVLPGGYSVMWTGMKVLKHDGSVHHGVGILPTRRVVRTPEGIAAGRDEVLEAGVRAAGGER